MEDILSQIDQLELTPDEYTEFSRIVDQIIKKKKNKYHIDWLINSYDIDQPFYFLTHGTVNVVNYNGVIYFSMKYPNRHNPDGWESEVFIKFINNNVVDIIFSTDRYVIFEYSNRDQYPYGQFQGTLVEDHYQDVTIVASIKSQIDEVKQFCQYFFKL